VMNAEPALIEREQERATRREIYADTAQEVEEKNARSSEYGAVLEEGYYLAVPLPTAKFSVLGKLKRWFGFGDEGGILFGQASVKSTFAHGPHAGRTIGQVAQDLRAGTISPDSLPVEYVIRNGQAIALNNRTLLALTRAGMQPTVTRNLTGNRAAEALLDSHLQGGMPSNVIRVRGGPAGTSLIE